LRGAGGGISIFDPDEGEEAALKEVLKLLILATFLNG
jgi:hypothetical protein